MASQRLILGSGLAILLVISAASIGLDVKSRSEIDSADRTLGILKRISDTRPLPRGVESAARAFALTGDASFADEFREQSAALTSAFDSLMAAVKTAPEEAQLLAGAKTQVDRGIALGAELIRLRSAGDTAGAAALMSAGESRALMDKVGAALERLVTEERRVLGLRTDQSKTYGRLLLAIDLAGVAMILLLAIALTLAARRASRELQGALSATKATNLSLEGKVAERTKDLGAALEELRRSTSVMETTFRTMAEAVLVIDGAGTVLLSNPAAEKMLRYKPGMTVRQLRAMSNVFQSDGVTPMQADDMPSARALRGEEFDGLEFVAKPVRGAPEIHLVVSGRPLRDGDDAITGAALIYHDITASRETEHKLQQAQKLDAIGKLTGGVAHDFNNMLTVITGTTETLVDSLRAQPQLAKTAELIDRAAERCRELIQHLLAFARRQPLEPRTVDINGTVVDIAKLLRPTLGEQIEINSVLAPDVASVHIDPSQLANSLLNMAINARDAMPNGGKLLFETSNIVLDDAYAAVNPDITPGRYVLLAVSDTGTGMSHAVQDKVFEPFFTTKEVGKGSGLGMSMVYGFVKQSGGHIKIYSEEGHGTTIKLYLPPARGQVEVEAPAPEPVRRGSEVILVVEDDQLVRNYVVTQLGSLGYKTIAVPDARAALALVDKGEKFDLLFTDVIMPGGMNGRQLADEVQKRRPGIKVLYTSGYTENAIVHHGRLDEGVLLLAKPYRKAQLAGMLQQALGE
ncbi:PAS domain S-box-containing protein [Bradyrhizobium elkanii]|uniref:histidine kinase n=1 Tax=Bradyrhizobium elkanii TaxID=29448 RepID=A0A7Y8RAT7_BRAEL|nr:CHASE3 domain-containing protein [Bradyrhizobium elkanii]MBP1297938.1 PAS domain S-box-containing protein [Bradyrhizobium elkanii]MBP2426974.1 PAS domain S-box-containing protein [Bradyrhizobium elkanii]MCP1757576.1 PAS domain S-box-containing protein [Bradyrhizobium elkanii]MCP1970170.1 PAS domain S-box-containing protein [Bradyrhizobium elkanii]MCP1983090.1 PAS domain S-box-containing protein [Bradyrhizobium elkanii]